MSKTEQARRILVIEDGDEYLETLNRFIPEAMYMQAKSGREALNILESIPIDVVFLDMRFDRTPRGQLLGDHASAMRLCNGQPDVGWKYLADHQGLFILDALKKNGFGEINVVISYDFTHEKARLRKIKRRFPNVNYVPDNADLAVLRKKLL